MGYEDNRSYDREDDDIYKIEKKSKDDKRPFVFKEKTYEERPKTEIRVVEKQSMPRIDYKKPEPLKRSIPKILGNLFDRVDFLKQRIDEINGIIEERKTIHSEIVKEIEDDISEKEDMIIAIGNMDEKRNLKLDISILRRDRRNEILQFWKDLLELNTELRELNEQYITESKIMGLFKNIESD